MDADPDLATVYTVFDRKDFLPIILEINIGADKPLSEALAGQSDLVTHYHAPFARLD
jgi:hypothetical protein